MFHAYDVHDGLGLGVVALQDDTMTSYHFGLTIHGISTLTNRRNEERSLNLAYSLQITHVDRVHCLAPLLVVHAHFAGIGTTVTKIPAVGTLT